MALKEQLLLEELPPHNEAIDGDSLYSIQLNYKWRKIIAGLLSEYFWTDESEIALTNDNLLTILLLDLYTAEAAAVAQTIRLNRVDIGANRSTTSTSFVLVTGTNFSHTPTYAHMLIECYSIALNNSGLNTTEAEVRFNAVAGSQAANARMFGSTGISMVAIAEFTGLTVGVAHDIALYWKVTAATGNMFQASHLVYKITEWDD